MKAYEHTPEMPAGAKRFISEQAEEALQALEEAIQKLGERPQADDLKKAYTGLKDLL